MKKAGVYVQAVFYILAGINHFWHPGFYKTIMPPWLPQHELLISLSGICEIVFGALLLPKFTRRAGAWLIIFLLIAIFPANIQMAINFVREHNPNTWIAFARLPLQILLIWWGYIYTKK